MTAYFRVATRFTGNAVEVEPASTTIIKLKSTGEQYTYGGIKSVLNNLLVGTMWIDMYGDIQVKELSSKRVFHLSCVQCGWFSAGWHEVSGDVINEEGEIVFQLNGKWNESIYATRTKISTDVIKIPRKKEPKDNWDNEDIPENIPFSMTLDDIPAFSIGSKTPIWHNIEEKCLDEPYTKWSMTQLSVDSCSFDGYLDNLSLPKTDSRRRQDRIALEELDNTSAASEKHRLEEAQRHKKKIRDEKNLPWIPKYFVEDEDSIHHRWTYKHNYPWAKKFHEF